MDKLPEQDLLIDVTEQNIIYVGETSNIYCKYKSYHAILIKYASLNSAYFITDDDLGMVRRITEAESIKYFITETQFRKLKLQEINGNKISDHE